MVLFLQGCIFLPIVLPKPNLRIILHYKGSKAKGCSICIHKTSPKLLTPMFPLNGKSLAPKYLLCKNCCQIPTMELLIATSQIPRPLLSRST